MGPAPIPASFSLRMDTVINGQVVYQSTMSGNCASVTASGTATITNPAASNSVPVLGPLGLVLLSGLLGLLGWRRFGST